MRADVGGFRFRGSTGDSVRYNGNRLGVDVCAVCNQKFDHVRMVLQHSPHQGSLPANTLFRVHRGAAIDKKLNGVQLASPARRHQRSFTAGIRGIRIGSRVQENVDHGRISVLACQVKRCHTVARGDVYFCAPANQFLRCLQIAMTDGCMQRRGAIRFDLLSVRVECRKHDGKYQ